MLKEGSKAPAFALEDKEGRKQSPGSSDYTVVYFYPRDSTPGCTLEAQEFTKVLSEFKKRKAEVFGISGGDAKSKEKFCSKYKLQVPLLSDPDYSVAKKFGTFGQKKFMGRSFMGIHRSTFILDKSNKVVKVFESVKPEGHAHEVLKFIDSLKGAAKPKATKKALSPKSSSRKGTGKSGSSKTPKAKAVGRSKRRLR